MHFYGSASAEPFFCCPFPGELGSTTAHLRRLPRKGRAGGAYKSLLKHRVQGAALPAMLPSSPSADYISDATLRLCFGRAVFCCKRLKYPPLRSGYKSRNFYFYLWTRNACGRFWSIFSRLGRNGKQPFYCNATISAGNEHCSCCFPPRPFS